jgi:hypothetical protein
MVLFSTVVCHFAFRSGKNIVEKLYVLYWFLLKLCKSTLPYYFKRFSNFTTMRSCEQAIQTVGPCLDFSISPRASKRSLFNKFEEHIWS